MQPLLSLLSLSFASDSYLTRFQLRAQPLLGLNIDFPFKIEREMPERRKRDRDEDSDASPGQLDDEITDVSSSDLENDAGEKSRRGAGNAEGGSEDEELDSDEEFKSENPADKRRRLAKQYLENLKSEAREILTGRESTVTAAAGSGGEVPTGEGAVDEFNNFDASVLDRDIIASRLKQDIAEQKGRVYRLIGDKLLLSEAKITFTRVGDQNPTCISCYQPQLQGFTAEGNTGSSGSSTRKPKDALFAYTVSKDMQLTKYDVTDFNRRPQKMKYKRGGKKYIPSGSKEFENTTEGHYDEILAVAASPDGKYVVTGGRDRKLIIWSAESLAPVKVIPTKDRRGEVLGLVFRKNSDQLYVSCADCKIRTYSINQFSQLETLYGHQDLVACIDALNSERCVTVGSRDRTAMLWKIPDETRLTFRGGDDPERLVKKWLREHASTDENGEMVLPDKSEAPTFYSEGSIDVISMIDESHFVTGSDNGNLALWSISKKKPIFVERVAHGLIPEPRDELISGESDVQIRKAQLGDGRLLQPYWITAIHAIPYSNVFVSGSWNGSLKVWKLDENMRSFRLLGDLPNCKGVVTAIQVIESGRRGRETFRVLASVAKEHRLGRWVSNVANGRNGIYSAVVEQTTF